MKKKKEKNNRIILLILILCLLFVLMILAITIVIKPKKQPQQSETKDRERIETTYVRPETISLIAEDAFFKAYEGRQSRETIMEKITDFVYYIVDNKQTIDTLSQDQIHKEYEEESDELNNIGIISEEDYTEIINTIQTTGDGELEYVYAIINEDTIKNEEKFISAELDVKFVEKEELKFMINISEEDEDNPVTFKVIEVN